MSTRDVWCAVLPDFHVGGLGIQARAHLSGARVVPMDWSPRALAASESTIVSLVPAQVHDLVEAGVPPPARLRAVLVGGGGLDAGLDARVPRPGAGRCWPATG